MRLLSINFCAREHSECHVCEIISFSFEYFSRQGTLPVFSLTVSKQTFPLHYFDILIMYFIWGEKQTIICILGFKKFNDKFNANIYINLLTDIF